MSKKLLAGALLASLSLTALAPVAVSANHTSGIIDSVMTPPVS